MQRQPVQSSSLLSVGWQNGTLEIEFTSRGIYRYADVDQATYKALMEAESKGRFFVTQIKPNHACTTLFKPEKKEKKDGKDAKPVQSGGERRGVPDVPARRPVRHNRPPG